MFKPHFKRFYNQGDIYSVSTSTNDRFPFFNDYGCAKIFLETIRLGKQLLNFELYAFIIMPDHFHADICPKGDKNISQIMQFIKRHVSRHINDKLKFQVDEICKSRLPEILDYTKALSAININPCDHLFKWQKSFYERRLRNDEEFMRSIEYINEKNLLDLCNKYHLLTEAQIESYPFYSHTNPDLIDAY